MHPHATRRDRLAASAGPAEARATPDDAARAAAANLSWSFHCSACGKCCNSAPQMSLPELFHHQRRFVGCLAIQRVARPRPGDRAGEASIGTLDETDCAAFSELANAVLHCLPGGPDADYVLLATQGFTHSPSDPCPALGFDMQCTLHHDRKPTTCSVVPLDAFVPDRMQHLVLARRMKEAVFLGAECIALGSQTDFAPLTDGHAVVDHPAKEALARRRRDLADDKRRWGDAVFGILGRDLFADEAALSRVPVGGFLAMAIAPVLVVLAAVSPRCRRRCIDYVDAQIVLIEETIRSAVARKRLADLAGLQQLRSFARTSLTLRAALWSAPVTGTPRSSEVSDVETWIGLGQPYAERACTGPS
jgi:Fe-S-cluster containining protein